MVVTVFVMELLEGYSNCVFLGDKVVDTVRPFQKISAFEAEFPYNFMSLHFNSLVNITISFECMNPPAINTPWFAFLILLPGRNKDTFLKNR